MNSIPDFSKLERRIKDNEKSIHDADKARRNLEDDYNKYKLDLSDKFEKIDQVTRATQDDLNVKTNELQIETDLLKKRPVSTGGEGGPAIDMTLFASAEDI